MSSSPKLQKPETLLTEEEWIHRNNDKISSISNEINSLSSSNSTSSTYSFTSQINSFIALSASIHHSLTVESPLLNLNSIINEKKERIFSLSVILKKLQYSQCLHDLHAKMIISSTNTETLLECYISLIQLKPLKHISKSLLGFQQELIAFLYENLNQKLEEKLTFSLEEFPVILEIKDSQEFLLLLDQFFLLKYYHSSEDVVLALNSLIDLFIQPLRRRFLFHYHHKAGRPTSSIEHPEWPLRFIKDCLFDNYDFLLLISPMNRFNYPIPTPSFMSIFIKRLLFLIVEVFQARLIILKIEDPLIIKMIEEVFKFLLEIRPLTEGLFNCTQPLIDLFFPSLNGDYHHRNNDDYLSTFLQEKLLRAKEAYACLKEEENASTSLPNASLPTKSFPILINSQLKELFELPNNSIIRSIYWKQVIFPLWEYLFKDLEEDLSFCDDLNHRKTLSITLGYLNIIHNNIMIQWNGINEMELIGSEEFKSIFEDGKGKKAAAAQAEYLFGGQILGIIKKFIKAYKNEILKWIWEEYMRNGAIGWSRGMLYAIESKEERSSDLIKSLNILERSIIPIDDGDIRGAIVNNCCLFVFDSVILQNYYKKNGISRFKEDISFFKMRIMEIFPNISYDWKKIDASLLVITSSPQFKSTLQDVMRLGGGGGGDITDELASTFNGIFECLSIEECGKIISLCK